MTKAAVRLIGKTVARILVRLEYGLQHSGVQILSFHVRMYQDIFPASLSGLVLLHKIKSGDEKSGFANRNF